MRSVALMATVAVFGGFLLMNSADVSAAKKREMYPDFAYPQTVEKKANAALSSAIAAGDWEAAVKATVESVTAANLVSRENAIAGLAKIDSVAGISPKAWQPAFRLIQADIYNSIYNSFRWQADQRKLPLDSVPANPFDWSREIFAEKIHSLCSQALDCRDNDGKSLKVWNGFLTNTSDAYKYGMTVDEFVDSQCFTLLNIYSDETKDVIPFFAENTYTSTPTGRCTELRNTAIENLVAKTNAAGQYMLLANALLEQCNTLPYNSRMKATVAALDRVKGTEGEQMILRKLNEYAGSIRNDNNKSAFPFTRAEYLALIRQSIKDFPDGRYVNSLKDIVAEITQPFAEIEFQNQYLTSDEIVADTKLTNCNEAYMLVYDYSRYAYAEKQPRTKDLVSSCRLMKAVKVTADGTVPFNAKTRTVIGQLPKGTYVIVPSATPDGKGIYYNMKNDRWRNFFTVSDISVMTLACPDATSRVFVVEGLTGRPIEGATVKVYTNENYRVGRQLAATLTTGKDGSVTVKEKRFEIEASHDGSVWKNRTRLYNNSSATPDTILRQHVQILADRSIYHPGDSISAAVIAYSARNFEMSLSSASEISLRLLDANGKEIASQSLMTDSFGRASTDFIIPEQGLLGSWRLTAADRDGKMLGSCWLQVADYVAPTFFITTDHSEGDINPGDTVTVKGQVITYSGMPLADATVNYSVVYNPPMRWFADGGATYDSSVKTDSEGRFIISLPTSNLKGTQFERGIFTVNITATSAAGETQSGPTERFGIGQEYHIIFPSQDMNLEISDSIPALTFFVTDMLGRKIRKQLNYRLIDSQSNTAIAEGSFESPSLILPAKDYISAKYDLEVSLAEDPEVKTDAEVTLWKKTDNIAPAGTGLWIPQRVVKARPGSKTVDVTVGSGVNDRWIPAVLSGNDKVLSVEWLHIESSNVSISVEAPTGDTPYSLSLKSISDLMQQDGTIEIQPSESKSLEIKTLSFRDKISAGDDEQWSFLFSRTGVGVKDMPVLAVMTDASLNALYPFDWSFAPLSRRGDNFYSMRLYSAHSYNQVNALKAINYLSVSHIANPDINDYGQGWGIGYHGMNFYANGLMSRSAVSRSFLMKSEAKMSMADVSPEASGGSVEMIRGLEDGVTVETVEEAEEALSYADSSDGAGNGISATYELRETECPVAFFKPYLTTDSDGVVTIDFTVPNFNTTWALQVLGYDESLQTAKVALEAVASKPVMVSTHAPRFVRTGDEIMLTATIFNNTGDECPAGARIELVDLVSGKIIKAKDFAAENLAASASRVVSMSWTVASDVSSVGFRAYAEAAGHRDGEQALVPVLPASSPVVESTPFWIIPGSEEIEVKLPGFKDTDQVTLQYCDNPAWFCLTALPDIVRPESKSITARMQALFGNVMAYNLISSNSGLRTGLEALLSDRNSQFAAMKSNLEKDGNLKITQLNNTPWVNSAESETLRMSRLSTLLDDKGAQTVINDLIDEIRQMQTPEGGWSWCPDMEPSSYITRDVLRHFGMMARADALKKFGQTEAMIKKGIRYVDSETVKDYRKYHKKDESLSYLLDWLYVRSSFPAGYISDHDMTSLARKAEKDIAAEWKEMGIGAKAKAAVVLWRAGNRRVASEILESLRQYASYSPEKGMWYDNIGSGWGGMSALQTTTLVLEAYAEIQPANENIDRLRQWLILGRQVQDWGRNSRTVETVDAILTSGSDWTQAKAAVTPEFYIKGKRINIPETAALTGSFTLTLNAKDASKKTLKICRQGASPAWGGVIAQYEAPIMEVVPSEVPELSIRKNVVALVEGKDGSLVAKEGVTLKKGMLVRVTLTITAGRDMDYVAVTDERSACLEPTQQLSGYTWSDGTGFYREVRDSSTNLFFGWLPKGHHVVSYDCRVSQEGEFSCGIATAQSQYSPLVTAHSAGAQLNVE